MLFRTGLKQTLRAPVKLIAYFLVAAFAAALLCAGFNLEANAQKNIAAADAAFTIIAVPEVWEMVRQGPGQLTPEMIQQYLDPETGRIDLPEEMFDYVPAPAWVTEEEYDFSAIAALPGVERIDARGRFGARVNGETQVNYGIDPNGYPCQEDVIVFSFDGPEPLVVRTRNGADGAVEPTEVPITVHFSANRLYRYGDSIGFINWLDSHDLGASANGASAMFEPGGDHAAGSFVLEPGKQYIAALIRVYASGSRNSDGVVYRVSDVTHAHIASDAYHNPRSFPYSSRTSKQSTDSSGSVDLSVTLPQLPIAEYHGGFLETEEDAFYKEVIEAYTINSNSLTAIATEDMTAMRPFHSGEVFISEGRAIAEEEYAEGASVCVVSAAMAEHNGWKLGDTLSLSFYDYPPIRYNDDPDGPNTILEWQYSSYTIDSSGFFDEGEYTIIGLFDGRVEFLERKEFNSTIDKLHAVNIIIPEASVENAPAPSLYKYTSTIRLTNSKAIDFINGALASGLMDSGEPKTEGYELRLTVYDQGYSMAAPGLEQLSRVSRLTILLASAAAGLAVLILAVVHVMRGRRGIAAMRSLGTKKGQVMAISLMGVLLVCCLGAAAGAGVGHMLSDEVAERVLASAEQEETDTAFTAMMGEDEAKTFEFTLGSDPQLALLAGGAVVLVFGLVSLLLIALEFRQPPMALLGAKE